MPTPREYPSRIGRPRNIEADSRILKAALCLYGESGWHGFNLTKVAAQACVGKSSMYSRWADRERLLLDAFRILVPCPGPIGETVHDILVNEAEFRMRLYLGCHAEAVRRVFVETGSTNQPVIRRVYEHLYVTPIGQIRSRLWEFKTTGALPRAMSMTRLLDAIEGSVLMRAFCLAIEDIDCFLTEIPEYAEHLVTDQLQIPHDHGSGGLRVAS
ncbi:MAG: TetR/AcrR family transcriptional regulator [Actinomycetaceae bacterium]|jgi:AcrR family transcriptional regulator|nr:TetR/AcrR family transcriptional regulator [Actinomycetaceae bacterium]